MSLTPPARSCAFEKKYSHLPSRDQPSSCSAPSSNVTRRTSPVANVRTWTSPPPVRVETNANCFLSGEYIGRLSLAALEISRRASPPDAGTVQMSPPETKAISVPSGEMPGSAKAGFAAGAGRVCASSAVSRQIKSERCIMRRLYRTGSTYDYTCEGSWRPLHCAERDRTPRRVLRRRGFRDRERHRRRERRCGCQDRAADHRRRRSRAGDVPCGAVAAGIDRQHWAPEVQAVGAHRRHRARSDQFDQHPVRDGAWHLRLVGAVEQGHRAA